MKDNPLWQLWAVFAPLSLLSIGGGQSVMADIQQQAVANYHWLSLDQFLDDYAIARACPGPGSLIVTLIGWQVAGFAGALVASLGIFLPASLLFYGFTLFWRRHAAGHWRGKLARGLAPVSVGLLLASSYTVLVANGGGALAWLVSAAALMLLLVTRIHPFAVLAGGAGVFLFRGLGYY
jgi:chromate transporter